jgi:hypothetical protein
VTASDNWRCSVKVRPSFDDSFDHHSSHTYAIDFVCYLGSYGTEHASVLGPDLLKHIPDLGRSCGWMCATRSHPRLGGADAAFLSGAFAHVVSAKPHHNVVGGDTAWCASLIGIWGTASSVP